jgi:hypothetical protein
LLIHLHQLVLLHVDLPASLLKMRPQLFVFGLFPGDFIGDVREISFDGLKSESIFLVDIKLILECHLNLAQIALQMLVDSQDIVSLVAHLPVLVFCVPDAHASIGDLLSDILVFIGEHG